ncbi:Effector protein GPP [Meloidogyne graminicola]|uniref:Effector protein GPP n=1 Tax=Meloidogyne graminicola TaxID=189291 RepID=A0A8S9ZBN3_9BILA|nr:Effector protein GPP [Meloidogyne graminicola]
MEKKFLLFFFVFIILEAFILGATLPKDKKITKNDFSDGSPQQNPNNVPIGIKQTKAYQDSVHCPDNTNNCYIPPLYTTQETGLANATYNVIDQYLNKSFTGGKIVFHRRTGGTTSGGECGLGISYRMHAGVGSVLWAQPEGQGKWVKSKLTDLPGQDHYIRDDKLCVNKCVKIEYQDKVLTVPIMDETKEKHINELDVTLEAFEWLKPFPAGWTDEQKEAAGGEIKPVKITYINCP